ncbi:class II aldolase/adducin family protein [Aurantiacibacter luteus]|uniref:Aldolase n=1 Tax=Aurantiacibacter luteus TaxID=1581420 RepID=A0A0G9MP33_9SPHN|nr:class II aldolase/adducin family protein [Aurantiacibacter luteus]KLE32482.1 aldolase [Aurantiacibacter luteus]
MATQLKSRMECSAEEWAARLDLAAAYRIFAHLGWCESIYNHITLRVPGTDDHFLINPFGLLWDEVTASNLVKIDGEGNKLGDNPYPVNLAGFVQHSVFHKRLPHAHAIVHTHTPDTMAVCATEGGLQASNFYSCFFAGGIGYHDFEGITVRAEEGERLIANVGEHSVLMLKNHGPVVMGRTIHEMFLKYYMLQRACEIQVKTAAMGAPILVSDEVIATHQRDGNKTLTDAFGKLDFEAWTRKIDTLDPSWRN